MNAADIMTEDPMTVAASARVRDALEILRTMEIRHLPVVSAKGALIGMLSDRDLSTTLDTPISSVMSSDVVSVGPETSVAEIIDLMLENRIGAVPVIDPTSNDLLGIVSYVDVLRELRKDLD